MKLQVICVYGIKKLTVVIVAHGAAVEHRVHMFGHRFEFALFMHARPLRIKTCGLRFEGLADFISLANLFRGWQAHAGSHTRPALDQSIVLKRLQCLGHGQETHAKLRRQLAARKRRAERDLALQDAFPDCVISVFR